MPVHSKCVGSTDVDLSTFAAVYMFVVDAERFRNVSSAAKGV